jgi:L-seryl-tRNA(Ser) seleniumtransferase
MSPNPLRNLPSVHELLETPAVRSLLDRIHRSAAVSTVKTVLDEVRREVQTAAADWTLPNASDLAERIAKRLAEGEPSLLRPVINATGVWLDQGLGRAPLAEAAIVAMAAIARDYASIDWNCTTGEMLCRNVVVEGLLCELTGAEAAFVVGNNAGATMLATAALAHDREVLVSRGQLIELDGGYRLPEIIATVGARLHEVGAINQTTLEDYERAIGDSTAAMMLVHAGNGTSKSVSIESLVELGRRHQISVIHNLGSGTLIDLQPFGIESQPLVGASIRAGADAVLLSGDKLLGGPQGGIILGRKALIEKMERHPIARAVRVDKVTLAGLIATLQIYRKPERARVEIPILRLLTTSADNLKNRAERLAPQASATSAIAQAEAVSRVARLDWSASPTCELPTWCVALKPATMSAEELAAALRSSAIPIVSRIEEDRVLLDLRTVLPRHDLQLISALESLGKSPESAEAEKPQA